MQRLCRALLVLLAVQAVAPGKVGHEIVKGEPGRDVMACVDADPLTADQLPNAYMVMIGPFSGERKYKKWLYAAIALTSALQHHGSTADVVVLCALKAHGAAHAFADEEALLSQHGIHWRYVSAPYGNGGFHMGHFKTWAWQHTEYGRVQLLDADLLPLTNMDRFFDLGRALDSDFVGCPGKLSVLNAGWFVLKPSCSHFDGLTQLLHHDGPGVWTQENGWGHPLAGWVSSEGGAMKAGWDFFDAHGNQGHMYSYFLFDAHDLTLIYADKVLAHRNGTAAVPGAGVSVLEEDAGSRGSAAAVAALKQDVYGAYPCPFPLKVKARAYVHFTGNLKPWTKHNPRNPQFQAWYDAVTRSGAVDLQRDVFA